MSHALLMIGLVVIAAVSAIVMLDSRNTRSRLCWGSVFALALAALFLHILSMNQNYIDNQGTEHETHN